MTDNDGLLPDKKNLDITYDIITFLEDIKNTNIIDINNNNQIVELCNAYN